MSQSNGNSATKVELAVQMKCSACKDKISSELSKLNNVKVVDIDVQQQRILLELTENSSSVHEIQSAIESKLGLSTVVKGLGDSVAAVSEITGEDNIAGVVRFTQLLDKVCLVDGIIDGIRKQDNYSLNIHEFGDLSGEEFRNVGSVIIPVVKPLNAAESADSGRASFKTRVSNCDLSACIGRSLAVSLQDKVLAAGIVARASSVGDNTKRICDCSGRTLWDERAIKQVDPSSRL